MATNPMIDDFSAKTAVFLAWLHQQPGASISPKIKIADLREYHAGRGIVAVEDIEEDEELFSVAYSTLLTVQNSGLQEAKADILERLDAWNALVLVLIYEDGLGKKSTWYPYLNILPCKFDTLIYWSASELAELQGSAVLDKVGKHGADEAFKKCLLPVVQQNAALFGRHAQAFGRADAEIALVSLAHRMATLIMAYGFDLEAETSSSEEDELEDEEDGSSQSAYEPNKGMVPLADLFNANGDSNNAHLLQHESLMTMIALRKIPKGEQIYNDFGQLPRSDLLRRYGYVTDNYRKWDVAEVDIEIVTQAADEYVKLNDEEKEDRLELAAVWESLQDGYDLTRPLENKAFKFDKALILTITALLLNAEDLREALEKPPEKPPQSVTRSLNSVLKKVIFSRQNSYTTTIAEDANLLDDPTIQGRHRMAVAVRLGEKEILAMADDEVERRIAKTGVPAREDQENSQVKRRKV